MKRVSKMFCDTTAKRNFAQRSSKGSSPQSKLWGKEYFIPTESSINCSSWNGWFKKYLKFYAHFFHFCYSTNSFIQECPWLGLSQIQLRIHSIKEDLKTYEEEKLSTQVWEQTVKILSGLHFGQLMLFEWVFFGEKVTFLWNISFIRPLI